MQIRKEKERGSISMVSISIDDFMLTLSLGF